HSLLLNLFQASGLQVQNPYFLRTGRMPVFSGSVTAAPASTRANACHLKTGCSQGCSRFFFERVGNERAIPHLPRYTRRCCIQLTACVLIGSFNAETGNF